MSIGSFARTMIGKDVKIDSGSCSTNLDREDGKFCSYFYLLLSIILTTMRILSPDVTDYELYYFDTF